jgi:hypothetical protein
VQVGIDERRGDDQATSVNDLLGLEAPNRGDRCDMPAAHDDVPVEQLACVHAEHPASPDDQVGRGRAVSHPAEPVEFS